MKHKADRLIERSAIYLTNTETDYFKARILAVKVSLPVVRRTK